MRIETINKTVINFSIGVKKRFISVWLIKTNSAQNVNKQKYHGQKNMYKIITLEIFSTVKPSLPVTYGIPLVDIPRFFSSL